MHMRSRNEKENGLFDEFTRMAQSSCAMKWTGILVAMILSGLVARAQETNSAIDTNLVSAVNHTNTEAATSMPRDENANDNERWMSLPDCIQIALEHNF